MSNNPQQKSPALIVKNGFQYTYPFTMPKYAGTQNKGFLKWGTIAWKTNLNCTEAGNIIFTIPNLHQKSVRIMLEGITQDGQPFSDAQILEFAQ